MTRSMKKKVIWKLLEIVGILLFQIIIGYFLSSYILDTDWDLISFFINPGMIAFWGAYLIIELLVTLLTLHKNSAKK